MAKIRTYDGRLVDPLAVTKEDVIPHVLIHSICLLNRFTGHTKHPYSVGQHTLNLVRYVPEELRRAALIHDWQEGWFNDLASPLKHELVVYRAAEGAAGDFVADTMGVTTSELEALDPYDKSIYVNERNALFLHIDERGMGDERNALADHSGQLLDFREKSWRSVKNDLLWWYDRLFPEFSTELEAAA